jgi:hypothetical protein
LAPANRPSTEKSKPCGLFDTAAGHAIKKGESEWIS